MPKIVDSNEFYDLQGEVSHINKSIGVRDFLEETFYWFPYWRKYSIHHLKPLINRTNWEFLASAYFGWGINEKTLRQMKKAVKAKKPFFFLEDGFLRSLYHGGSSIPFSYKVGRSFTIDLEAPYYCGDLETDLENEIKNTSLVDQEERKEVRGVIDKIVCSRISKYNHQPVAGRLSRENDGPIVLVIGQNYGDKSLQFGGVGDDVFDRMLGDALTTGGTVYYKVHPDVIDSGRETRVDDRVHFLMEGCNPLSLLEQVDKVYVATSQMGFEALLLGKSVRVYGKPFYAGWGLTEDMLDFPRRNTQKSILDLFYATYMKYSCYVYPEESRFTTLDAVIETLCHQRKERLGF